MIVVDTNVMVKLVVGGADGAEAARLYERDQEWAAPPILISELRNVLVWIHAPRMRCLENRPSQ